MFGDRQQRIQSLRSSVIKGDLYTVKKTIHGQRVTIVSLLLIIVGILLIGDLAMFGIPNRLPAGTSSLGASLVTAGLLTMTLDRLAVRAMSERIEDQLYDRLHDISLVEAGLVKAIDETPFDELCKHARQSREIVIVQTWAPSLPKITKAVEQSLMAGAKLRIFLLHPDSPMAEIRSLDLQERSDHVSQRVKDNINIIRSLYARLNVNAGLSADELAKRIEVKLYSSMPACAIYKMDSVMYVASYWVRGMSAHRLNYVLQSASPGLSTQTYLRHIEELESASVSVKLGPSERLPTLEEADQVRNPE